MAVNVPQAPPHGRLERAGQASRSTLSRQAKAGRAIRLAPGLYAVGATLPPEQVARHHMTSIIAEVWPGGVLCGLTALSGGTPTDGTVYVAHPGPQRKSALRLPGLTIIPVVGPRQLPGDMLFPDGLALSGPARTLVENVDVQGRPAKHRAGTSAVEDRIDELSRSGGAGRIRGVLDQLDVIAGSFDPAPVELVRSRLAAVLGSFTDGTEHVSPRLAARLAGTPFDQHRIDMLGGLIDVLQSSPPNPRPATGPTVRWEWLRFFEAYFSNFIEGIEFGVDEARRIAVEGVIPQARPQDAHDVAATYRLATDPTDQTRAPASGEELLAILQGRHRTLMAARPTNRPGEFKKVLNYAGGYQFVEPSLVAGTLVKGFELLTIIRSPFARAVAMMALITECHPFDDGNGRVARLTANAELSVAGEVRIVLPNIYRNNYLAALTGFSSRAGRGESLVAVLDFAQRWAATVDWSNYKVANETMIETNAYEDSSRAEATGLPLVMPPTIGA